ncbi:hypothetical protein [Rhizobium metallidurans]|uniref:Uncharacterized protein n=1 Tax=Rhizobium metallidurans TaxID=1265931 RepID=A0A7W6CUJ6_9HYPH|nr:hypothetical protein [Rhizobium metallidurans]MBB3962661.1 hypothetical protein [Rhizobium metallidurans]
MTVLYRFFYSSINGRIFAAAPYDGIQNAVRRLDVGVSRCRSRCRAEAQPASSLPRALDTALDTVRGLLASPAAILMALAGLRHNLFPDADPPHDVEPPTLREAAE